MQLSKLTIAVGSVLIAVIAAVPTALVSSIPHILMMHGLERRVQELENNEKKLVGYIATLQQAEINHQQQWRESNLPENVEALRAHTLRLEQAINHTAIECSFSCFDKRNKPTWTSSTRQTTRAATATR